MKRNSIGVPPSPCTSNTPSRPPRRYWLRSGICPSLVWSCCCEISPRTLGSLSRSVIAHVHPISLAICLAVCLGQSWPVSASLGLSGRSVALNLGALFCRPASTTRSISRFNLPERHAQARALHGPPAGSPFPAGAKLQSGTVGWLPRCQEPRSDDAGSGLALLKRQ